MEMKGKRELMGKGWREQRRKRTKKKNKKEREKKNKKIKGVTQLHSRQVRLLLLIWKARESTCLAVRAERQEKATQRGSMQSVTGAVVLGVYLIC